MLAALAAFAHSTVEELAGRLQGSGVSISTVYRALGSFERAGLVGRLHVQDGLTRYHLLPEVGDGRAERSGDVAEHLHLWCRGCGQVLDVADRGAHAAVRASLVAAGLADQVGQLTVSGWCRTCTAR